MLIHVLFSEIYMLSNADFHDNFILQFGNQGTESMDDARKGLYQISIWLLYFD